MRAKTQELQDALNRLTAALEEELGVETYQPPTAAAAD